LGRPGNRANAAMPRPNIGPGGGRDEVPQFLKIVPLAGRATPPAGRVPTRAIDVRPPALEKSGQESLHQNAARFLSNIPNVES
jgi:hypothetical protein